MQEVLVSVVVPTYNHEAYISQCLDSILAQQTHFNFEIILGEDESNDGTRQICKDYAKQFPDKIKLFLRSRKDVIYVDGSPTGRYNFMECLKVSTGKYIALCEGDDYWTDASKLQKQIDFLEANPEHSFCFTRYQTLNEETGAVNTDYNNGKYYSNTLDFIPFDFELFEQGWSLGMQTLVFKKEALPMSSFHTYKYFRDVVLITQLLFNGKGASLNVFSAMYRIHQGGLHTAAIGSVAAKRGSLCYGELYKKHKTIPLFKKRYYKYHQHYVNDLIQQKSYGSALKNITAFFIAVGDFSFFSKNIKKLASMMVNAKTYNQ